uniref:MIF4G domain-containing protein n=1 Tax=Strongyloides stercoralis TaxID=6248 RepID=A0A0K0DZ21_STRER
MSTHLSNPHNKGGNKNRSSRKNTYRGPHVNSGNYINHTENNYTSNSQHINQQEVQFATPQLLNVSYSAPEHHPQPQMQHTHHNVAGQVDQSTNIIHTQVTTMPYFNGHQAPMGYVQPTGPIPLPVFHPNAISYNQPGQVPQSYPPAIESYQVPQPVNYRPIPAPVPGSTEFELVECKKPAVIQKKEKRILSVCDPETKKSIFDEGASNLNKDISSKESTPSEVTLHKSASGSSVKQHLTIEKAPSIRSRQNSERISELGGNNNEGSNRIKEEFKRQIAERAVGSSTEAALGDKIKPEGESNRNEIDSIDNIISQAEQMTSTVTESMEKLEVEAPVNEPVESQKEEEIKSEGKNETDTSGNLITTSSPLTKGTSKDQVQKKLSFASEQPKIEKKADKETYLEIEAEFKRSMEDPKFDIENCVYPKNFIRTYRLAVSLFKLASNPVSDEIKALLYYDKSSISTSMKGRRNDNQFQPPWSKTVNDQGRKSYGGRNSHGHSSDRRKNRNNAVARPSIERSRQNIQLHRSENAWKPSTGNDDTNSKLLKEVRGILNKITPTNFDALMTEFLQFRLFEKKEILQDVIDLIFSKAVEEPRFCSIYSDLYNAQVNDEKKQTNSVKSSFGTALIQKCQVTFEKKDFPFSKEMEQITEELKTETDENKIKEKNDRLAELVEKEKRFTFGTIRFIAHLYRHDLLVTKIISYCVTYLLNMFQSEKNEKALEQAVLLFETVGKHWSGLPRNSENSSDISMSLQHFKKYLPNQESNPYNLSKRMQFMIENLIETSENNWVSKNTRMRDGPKKIDEVHEEIKNEEIQNAYLRDQYTKEKDTESNKRKPYSGTNSVDRRYNLSKNSTINRKNTDLRDSGHYTLKTQAKSFVDGCNPKDTKNSNEKSGTIPRSKKSDGSRKDGSNSKRQASPQWNRQTTNSRKSTKAVECFDDDFYNDQTPEVTIVDVKFDNNELTKQLRQLTKDSTDTAKITGLKDTIERYLNEENSSEVVKTIMLFVFLDMNKVGFTNERAAVGRLIGSLLGGSKNSEVLHGLMNFCESFDDLCILDDCPLAWTYFGELLANAIIYDTSTNVSSEKLTLDKLDRIFSAAEPKENKDKFLFAFLKCTITEENLLEPIEDNEKRNEFIKSLIMSINKMKLTDTGIISEKMEDKLKDTSSKRDNKNLFECKLSTIEFVPLITGFETLPVLSSKGTNSLFQFGKAKKVEDFENPSINVDSIINKKNLEIPVQILPKGIYTYMDTERDFNSNFKLPDINNPIDISSSVKSKNNYINGLYLPMPFGMEPVNVQFFRENEQENAVEGAFSSEGKIMKAKEEARIICKKGPTKECDEALEKYYILMSDNVNEKEASLLEKLVKLTDSIGSAGYRNNKKKGLGVLLGLPGMEEPVYWKARFDNFDDNSVFVNANMPKYNN